MNPDDVVLVALVNSPRDLEIVELEHWYRVPVRHAPKYFAGAQYLAFYLSRAFGRDKWAIRQYAEVRGHELVRRRDLLPGEVDHPRAEELYYKLQLGPLTAREPPIESRRGRRVLFLWTDWKRFSTARQFSDLFVSPPAVEHLWEAIKESGLPAEREVPVREGRARYRVDFLIYLPHGRLGIHIGNLEGLERRLGKYRAMTVRPEELDGHFQRVLDRIRKAAREMEPEHFNREGNA